MNYQCVSNTMDTSVYNLAPDELENILRVLNAAINNHRCWFDKLHTAMLCNQPFPEDILHEAAHTQCQFGKWYYGNVNTTIRSFKEFEELEQAHKFMHDNARNLANLCMQNKQITVEDYQPFLNNQHDLIDRLTKLHDILTEHQYFFDALTGAVNRKAISLLLEQAFANVRRYNQVYSIAMLDADWFKKINDDYGHLAGDQVLKQISFFLRDSLRKSDCIGRYGGEEFLILMPETDQEVAYGVMEACRNGLSQKKIKTMDHTISISVSIGVAQFYQGDADAWQAVKRADTALYKAKSLGRNCVEIADAGIDA